MMDAEKVQQAIASLEGHASNPYYDCSTIRKIISQLEDAIKPEGTCKHCTSFDHCREEFGIKETSQECRMAKYYKLRRELEGHINGGGVHADIEERLSDLEDVDATTTGAFAIIEQRLSKLESDQRLHDKVLQKLSAKAYDKNSCHGCQGSEWISNSPTSYVSPNGVPQGIVMTYKKCDQCKGKGHI